MAPQYFYIVSKISGTMLHVKNGLTTDNAEIVQYTKSGGDNQKWAFEPEISEVLKSETTNSLDINGSVLTSTVNGASATIDLGSILGTKIASGKTTPGANNWHPIDGGIGVDVDTSAAGFTKTPIYVTSIAGDKYHWGTTGASSVYNPTPTSFSIQIRWDKGFWDANPLDLQEANSYKWHINWIAMEPSS